MFIYSSLKNFLLIKKKKKTHLKKLFSLNIKLKYEKTRKKLKMIGLEHKVIPKEFETRCDFCRQPYFSEIRNINKKKSGFPVYFLCDHCYDWSIAKKDKKYARKLNGNFFKHETSGKVFSEQYKGKYGKGSKKKQEKEKDSLPIKMATSVSNAVETAKDEIVETVGNAVGVVESAVSGIFTGAVDALGSLTGKKNDE